MSKLTTRILHRLTSSKAVASLAARFTLHLPTTFETRRQFYRTLRQTLRNAALRQDALPDSATSKQALREHSYAKIGAGLAAYVAVVTCPACGCFFCACVEGNDDSYADDYPACGSPCCDGTCETCTEQYRQQQAQEAYWAEESRREASYANIANALNDLDSYAHGALYNVDDLWLQCVQTCAPWLVSNHNTFVRTDYNDWMPAVERKLAQTATV